MLRLLLVGLSLVVAVPAQGCEISGQNPNFIDIEDVSLDGQVKTIAHYEVKNTLKINSVKTQNTVKQYFGANLQSNTLLIHTTPDFESYLELETDDIVTLTIDLQCQVGNTETQMSFAFTVYFLVTNDHAPVFSEPEYTLSLPLPLPANFELTIFQSIYATDIDLGDNKVEFSGGNEHFVVGVGTKDTNPKRYQMSLKTTRQLLTIPNDISFGITATDMGGNTGESIVKIKGNGEIEFERIPSPAFEKNMYHFALNENGDLTRENCVLKPDTFDELEVSFALDGPDSSYFGQRNEGAVVTIDFTASWVDEDFTARTYLSFNLLAKREGYDIGVAGIIVDLPVVCDEPVVTTPAPCEIVACPNDDGPVFSEKLYVYRINFGQIGVIGSVSATLDNPELLATLRYRLNYNDNPLLEDVLSIDDLTGQLTIVEENLPNTEYNIEVIATVEADVTTKIGVSRITIVLDANEICSGTPVQKSLTFVTIAEEKAHDDIFPMLYGECEFELLSVIPNDQEYLFVNENKYLASIAIDRESTAFSMMVKPQLQAKLKLVCPKTEGDILKPGAAKARLRRQLISSDAIEDFKDNVFTNEILFNSDILVLNLFIEDINDNPPVFVNPSVDPLTIGYPNSELVDIVLVPYLIQVKATDKDEPQHAKIEYSISANRNFNIDVSSGIIYPLSTPMSGGDGMTVSVSASDGLHTTNTVVKIRELGMKHVTVIYVENQGYNEAHQVADFIQQQLGNTIQILQHAAVPKVYSKRVSASSRSTADTTLKMLVYGIDNSGSIIAARDIQEQIDAIVDNSYTLSSVKLEDEIDRDLTTIIEEEFDNTVFIVVISILAVLLVILLVVAFVGWWFWIRPTEWRELDVETSTDNLQKDFKKPINVNNNDNDMMERPSLSLNGTTTHESTDTLPPVMKTASTTGFGYDNETMMLDNEVAAEPPSSVRERKKSITFNENVERIEIETEVAETEPSEATYKF